MPLTLDQYRELTNEAKQTNYTTYSKSFYEANGQIQIIKIGNTLQFFYNDLANNKRVNFAYYGTYQKAMGEDRIALKLEGCLSAHHNLQLSVIYIVLAKSYFHRTISSIPLSLLILLASKKK